MFCNKHCSFSMMNFIWQLVGIMVTLVGAMTVLGLVLSKCRCIKGKAKHLAHECECAVEDAADRISDAVEDCKTCRIDYEADTSSDAE